MHAGVTTYKIPREISVVQQALTESQDSLYIPHKLMKWKIITSIGVIIRLEGVIFDSLASSIKNLIFKKYNKKKFKKNCICHGAVLLN